MIGYLNVDKDKIEEGKRGLWQAFMCGLCFSTKRQFGNFPRMFISNDINFFNVLFHSVLQVDVELDKTRCFSHPVKQQTVLKPTDLTERLSVANVLLTYFNVYDDTVDGRSSAKKSLLKLLGKAYGKAKQIYPEMDMMLATRYNQLRELEQANCDNLDQVSHCFAQLTQDFCELVLGEAANEYATTLCYNVGKWIYLIDALDDAEKDVKRRNYNPFVAHYHATDMQRLKANADEIKFVMFAVLNRIAQSYNDLNLTKYTCILDNVLFDSIRNKTKEILHKYNQANLAKTE